MATELRGSEKLLSELIKKGSAATPDEVKAAVAVPAAVDYKLLRWLIRGLPPIYCEVETLFQVHPGPGLRYCQKLHGQRTHTGHRRLHLRDPQT